MIIPNLLITRMTIPILQITRMTIPILQTNLIIKILQITRMIIPNLQITLMKAQNFQITPTKQCWWLVYSSLHSPPSSMSPLRSSFWYHHHNSYDHDCDRCYYNCTSADGGKDGDGWKPHWPWLHIHLPWCKVHFHCHHELEYICIIFGIPEV